MEPYSSGTVPLSSSSQGWVQRISNIFRTEIALNIDHLPPVCVFEVPKTVSVQKPEAYTPQLIALGPYHHLRPELYQMERYKLAAIKELSTPEQIFNFQTLVINKMKEIDPYIRACYNKFMDYDQDTLAWIMAIDGCFFLHMADSYLIRDETTDKRLLDNTIITRDILMLENQIPFLILKEIRKALHISNIVDGQEDVQLISMLLQFCQEVSPIKFCTNFMASNRFHRPLHLLDLLYHMIVDAPGYLSGPLLGPIRDVPLYSEFRPSISSSGDSSSSSSSTDQEEEPELVRNNLDAILDVVESMGTKRAQAIVTPVKFVSSIPWSSISGIFRKGNLKNGEENSTEDEIRIPSVSHLWRYAKVQGRPLIGSINEVKFVEQEATLYLPVLNLNASSEVILRNLVAFEAAMAKSSLELARFINLVNGIVDTDDDVKLLKQNGVIIGSLKDDEIAEMFNCMKRNYVKSDHKSNIDVAIEEVNRYYDQKLVVRMVRRLKRNFYTSWKCLAVMSTVALMVLMSLQTFCEFYQCSKVLRF
ncbi:OLC1v1038118C1 [Oldenlandia corymbosa var. corymbosa]|uniref:OLC1v1038118C1 n=1 Tax=Oldenlandia corymbosa var. corymbosa TaxID=529605 RepID=A0AAV1CZQ2_OLDCO|nr:OLC1v1038118C1 [Oldenlandia corymbosa var. corymbosa]